MPCIPRSARPRASAIGARDLRLRRALSIPLPALPWRLRFSRRYGSLQQGLDLVLVDRFPGKVLTDALA